MPTGENYIHIIYTNNGSNNRGVFGPNLLRYRKFYSKLCTSCGLGHWWFVLSFGILGAAVAIATVVDMVKAQDRPPLMSESIWRNRLRRSNQRLVSQTTERDLKLMVTILSVEHYVLMIFGVFQKNAALLMPWLAMEAIIITLEAIFFGMRLFVEGLSISRAECLMSAIMVHNWFQVFCFFRKYVGAYDL